MLSLLLMSACVLISVILRQLYGTELRKLGSGASQGVTGKRGTFIVLPSTEFELNHKDKCEVLVTNLHLIRLSVAHYSLLDCLARFIIT